MPITAAQVEANGWVLRVTVTGSPGSFASYNLDPSGTPRLVLTSTHAGFVKSGGTAVAGTIVRATPGMVPLRQVVNPLSPTVKVIDETDLGGGSLRVRIALAETIYAGDTALALAVLAGWRTGEAAAAGIAVTNSSAVTAPLPIMRWALLPYEVTTGVFRLSLIVGSVHPLGFEPAAGVRFTATDGTTVKTAWATQLATDDSLGDNLRCYTVTLDPATATALTAGLLRCDAEVYPWLGAMRSTDPAGTRPMTTLRTDGFRTTAEAPFVIGHDPAGTRYSAQFAYVDPVAGSVTASAAMVQSTLADAKAAPSRPRDILTAIAAVALVNRTLPAANGQAAATRAPDGARIILAPGMHAGTGTTAVSSTITSTEIPVVIEGDPDNANPRANCIIDTASSGNNRLTRLRWRNLTVLAGGSSLNSSTTIYHMIDNIEVRGRSGSETVTTAPISAGVVPVGQINWHVTRSRVWRTGFSLGGASRQLGLVRACEFSRRATGMVFLKNRWITKAEDGFTAANTAEGMGQVVQTTDLGPFEDFVVAYNDVRAARFAVLGLTGAPAALAAVSPQAQSHRRHLILNNVFERISTTAGGSTTSDAFFGYGEATYTVMDNIVIEGNSFAGSGYNLFYSDPTPVTLADVNSQTNITRRIRHANNATDRNASKQDDFSDPNTASIRTANGVNGLAGYRPACIGAWSVHFGVGMEGHVDCSRSGSIPDFFRDFAGLRGSQYGTPTAPGWTSDRSEAGNDLGGGDYMPVAGSPFLGRISRANSDRDFAGTARRANGASGAFESGSAALTPASGRSGQAGRATAVGIALLLVTARSRHVGLATASGVGWSTRLVAAAALSAGRAGTAMIGIGAAAAVAPARSVLGMAATPAALGFAAIMVVLLPAAARSAVLTKAARLLPDAAAASRQTLLVGAEPRTLIPN